MASKLTLFTRFLKGWTFAPDNVVPADATKAVALETGNSFGWKATPVPIVPVPVLADIAVSPNTATVGTAYTGAATGKTAGSAFALSGPGSAGLTINAAGAISGTPTGAGAVNVVETLAGATGSPKTSSGVITVSA